MTDSIPATAKGSERKVARSNVVKRDSNRPQIHRGAESLPHWLPQHRPLVHVRMEILLGSVEGDKLLIVLQLSGRPEVGQLVHDGAVILDELHDVARFQVPEREKNSSISMKYALYFYVFIQRTCERGCCP